jgi:hypothetical protein
MSTLRCSNRTASQHRERPLFISLNSRKVARWIRSLFEKQCRRDITLLLTGRKRVFIKRWTAHRRGLFCALPQILTAVLLYYVIYYNWKCYYFTTRDVQFVVFFHQLVQYFSLILVAHFLVVLKTGGATVEPRGCGERADDPPAEKKKIMTFTKQFD